MGWFMLWLFGGIAVGLVLVPLVYAGAGVEHMVRKD